ncbi:MAG: folate-binding protein [Gammaproteobacteria bacterium]|nr:folate-binding protein [Gammaproteobacteria bacterium]
MILLDAVPVSYRRDQNNEIEFGSDEFQAITESPCACPVTDLAAIRITGSDARSFLHGQFTSDVRALEAGQGQLSAWCTPQGRVSFLFHLCAEAEGFLVLISTSEAARFVARLKMFVLRAQVVIDDCSERIAILGISAPRTHVVPEALTDFPPTRLVITHPTPTLTALCIDPSVRYLVWGEVSAVGAWWSACGLKNIGTAAWRALDIAQGLPRLSGCAINAFLPQELNLDVINAVSFDKGCYPGQEIIARLKYRGAVKSRLVAGRTSAAAVGHKLCRALGDSPLNAGDIITCVTTPSGESRFLAVVALNALEIPLHVGDPQGPLVHLVKF